MLISFKFLMEFGFDQVIHIFCSDPKVVAVSIHFEDFKVLTMKVIIQKIIIINFKHSEFGVVEDKDTKVNWQMKVNFLFSFFYFVIILRKSS